MPHTKKKNMSQTKHKHTERCEIFPKPDIASRQRLNRAVQKLVKSCSKKNLVDHVDGAPIPSTEAVDRIIHLARDLLFPGYFGEQSLEGETLLYHLGSKAKALYDELSFQIACSLRQICSELKEDGLCSRCVEDGREYALSLIEKLPAIRELLAGDVRAAYDGDPAATSFDEIVFSYPGLYAITVHRIAHELWKMKIPLLPRIMSEHAHSRTGIDIHPGASIGKNLMIDHGTGIVIGETTIIGNNVRLYQGVTLGALSFPTDEHGNIMRGHKRHPTIEDNVTIYANATILGGDTVIGKGAVIGGNVWITSSVPPNTTVILSPPELKYKKRK